MKKKIVKKYAQFSPPYGDGTEMNAAEKASF